MKESEKEQNIIVKIKICNVLIKSYQDKLDKKVDSDLSLEKCKTYIKREKIKLAELKEKHPEYFI